MRGFFIKKMPLPASRLYVWYLFGGNAARQKQATGEFLLPKKYRLRNEIRLYDDTGLFLLQKTR